MMPLPKTYSVRDLQRNYRAVLNDAKRTHDAIVLINNSVPEAVVLGIETYNALATDEYAWDIPYVNRLVREAKKSLKGRKGKKLQDWNELDG